MAVDEPKLSPHEHGVLNYRKPERRAPTMGTWSFVIGVSLWMLWLIMELKRIRVPPLPAACATLGGFVVGAVFAGVDLNRPHKRHAFPLLALVLCVLGAVTMLLAIGAHLLFSPSASGGKFGIPL